MSQVAFRQRRGKLPWQFTRQHFERCSYLSQGGQQLKVHVAEEASRRLAAAGFQKLSERQEWNLKPGGRYYFTRNLSTVVAFAVGAKYQPGNGLHMIGAHTDRSAAQLHHVLPFFLLLSCVLLAMRTSCKMSGLLGKMAFLLVLQWAKCCLQPTPHLMPVCTNFK